METPTCQRGSCCLPAVRFRYKTDTNSKEQHGMKREYLCIAHAREVMEYIGCRLWAIDETETTQQDYKNAR